MKKVEYLKCHGTGNTFYIIDEYECEIIEERKKKDFTIGICEFDKELDGLLFLVRGTNGLPKMRIFNVDGSEPEMCGNGLRCIARYAGEKLNKTEFYMETLKGGYSVTIKKGDIEGMQNVSIEIDNISIEMDEIPINADKEVFINEKIEELHAEKKFTALSVSNPHLVSIVNEIEKHEMQVIGDKIIELIDIFPEGINLSYLKIINEKEVFVRTFERGVGFTKSCGTGMMSAVTNLCINNNDKLNSKICVYNDGGLVHITINKISDKRFKATFEGNATYMESGILNLGREVVKKKTKNFSNENNAYKKLLEVRDSKINGCKM